MKSSLTPLLFVLIAFMPSLHAQDISYGFKVGINLSKLDGPSEVAADGSDLEEFKLATGFHVGADIRFAFTDLLGLKSGITFYQRGGELRYEGDGFQFFVADSGERVKASGRRRTITNLTNSYLDVPLTAYYRLADEKIEVFGGAHLSFLVGSVASGDLQFEGRSALTNSEIELESVLLDYNYFKDTPPRSEDLSQAPNTTKFDADGERISLPQSLTAYYDFPEKDRSVFNILDVGLQAGVNFYINRGLYAGFTFNYGLTDVTRDTYDVSRSESNELEYIPRDDIDHNLTLQFSLGFSF